MIKNLNRLSFTGYGQILPDSMPNRGFPEGSAWADQIIEVSSDDIKLYCLDATPMYLDYEQGMTVLAVSHNAGTMDYYYLDKPVLLNEGVYFAIIPFQNKCSVRYGVQQKGTWREMHSLNREEVRLHIIHQLEISNIYTLFYQEKEKGFFFRGESHEMLELIYVDKGSVHSVVGGVDIELFQGEMMIYGPGQWHMQYADMDVAASFTTITFDMQSSYTGMLINRKFKLPADAVQLLRHMLEERELDDMFSNDMIICKLQQFLLTVLRSDYLGKNKLKTPVTIYNENEIVNKALAYISENVYNRLSVSDVAREINISPSYLTALFHQCLQLSPGECIRRNKLEESKVLIKEGRLNFTQIAEALRYSTVHHFSRQFKEKFGITPTEYAKAIR